MMSSSFCGRIVVERFGVQFRVRDKVIQTENDYDKDVFNGDIGQVAAIDPEAREATVRFDSRSVVYGFGELDELSLLTPSRSTSPRDRSFRRW